LAPLGGGYRAEVTHETTGPRAADGGTALPARGGDALDQLEYEDRAVLALFEEFDDRTLDATDHGDVGKALVEHLAVRQAAKERVTGAMATDVRFADLVGALGGDPVAHRRALDRLDEMGRGVRGGNLNQGQDFDGAVRAARADVRGEIVRELETGLPALRRRLALYGHPEIFPTARFVRRHAPTHPGARPRWYERLGPVVRLHAVYDVLRGFPTHGATPSRPPRVLATPGPGAEARPSEDRPEQRRTRAPQRVE